MTNYSPPCNKLWHPDRDMKTGMGRMAGDVVLDCLAVFVFYDGIRRTRDTHTATRSL